eukprot:29989-Pelagococcus_subviridis.AAC.2
MLFSCPPFLVLRFRTARSTTAVASTTGLRAIPATSFASTAHRVFDRIRRPAPGVWSHRRSLPKRGIYAS